MWQGNKSFDVFLTSLRWQDNPCAEVNVYLMHSRHYHYSTPCSLSLPHSLPFLSFSCFHYSLSSLPSHSFTDCSSLLPRLSYLHAHSSLLPSSSLPQALHPPCLFCQFVPDHQRPLVHLFILLDRLGTHPVIYSLYYLRSYYSSRRFECQIQCSLTDGSLVVG